MPGVCARCHREVYFAEERLALGKVWHTFCFSCLNCRKLLDSCTVSTHRGELFCRNCYSRLFPTILRSSKESNASKETKTFPRVTSAPTKISVSESNCYRCRCCCCVEEHPIGEASSVDGKDYRSKKHRLRGGGEKKENSQSSTEGIDENPLNIPSTPRPCPRLSVRRVSFREERQDTLDRYRDMQNDRGAFSADRATRSRSIENCSNADILTIRSTEDVRRSDQDLHDEELMNYSGSVSPTHASRHDNTIVPEHNEEDNIAGEDMSNCNYKSFQDSRDPIRDNENADDDADRMRGGHGGIGSCRSRKQEGCCANKSVNHDYGCSSCQNSEDRCCGYRGTEGRRRFFGSEACPPREYDPCRDDHKGAPCRTAACSPPCADRHGCCPPVGCRPVCKKGRRSCCSPCKGETQGCGGGGCCGSGCRGGCGKSGQICMPARPCSTPPCRPHPPFGSPCVPPRACPPSPVCCRPASRGGCCAGGGGPSYCRSASPTCRTVQSGGCCCDLDKTCCDIDGADSCCKPRVPPGCECLGGGLDCQRCGRKVYQAEMQIVSGAPYHNICFSCFCCRKPLEPLTYQENCGEIYCKQCYIRNFGPQGYGYGVGAGALQTPM